MRHYRLVPAAAALLATASLTACSADSTTDATTDATKAGSGSVSASPSASKAPAGDNAPADDGKAALEKSVRAYTAALFGGAGRGYELVSKRCQADQTATEFVELSKQAHHEFGALTVKTLKVDQLSGDLARVSYGVGVPQFEREAQPWTREGGTWKWDACQGSGQ
ncbi:MULTISPECIES: hypothetical protein [Streptomyces]|uniref:Lipoprotein n=1 Tax=Streptomyces flavovirens TaxID=52258 RepID=A0ABV8NDQ5_9ACTN|nr:hypothetical protein [Streptomyces sp. MBT51]MBK3596289.1 hypothetical protein [Streptomyces sp. MBT51]